MQVTVSRPVPFVRIVFATVVLSIIPSLLVAGVVTLKNGMQVEGRLGKIAAIGEDPGKATPAAGGVRVSKVMLIDDELRRVFVSTNNLAVEPTEGEVASQERIRIKQRVAASGRRVGGVGPIVKVTPFDEWGRRIFVMSTPKDNVEIIQGITLVTPNYCKVEGLLGGHSYVWDMRVATSSIPRTTLSKVLRGALDPKNSADRLRIVRLYTQANRHRDAEAELKEVIKDFPGLRELTKQVTALRQSGARRLLQEIELRREAGQHRLAMRMLKGFPSNGVAGEILLEVREILEEYEETQALGDKVFELLKEHIEVIKDEALKAKIDNAHDEIKALLNIHSLNRMADYLRLSEDPSLTAEQKVALAISGWLLGSGSGTENIAVALDLVEVRNLVRQYLRSDLPHERKEILKKLESLEGSHPSYLSKIVAHLPPVVETQASEQNIPGFYELTIPGLTGQPGFTYYVQLPPEYNPQRRYPCVITLNGSGTTPQQQIDWFAGSYSEERGMRLGQATRRGSIIIAPVWTSEHQTKYKYSAREHAAVLYTLRDACSRFSIDTDRVFLSGHSMGGDAAWDIGLAHPDLWAGVMPIVATADKYVSRYYENARNVLPMYFVCGEMDGNKMERNKMDLNRYMRYAGYDVTVVQYQGRGHEHFHDEVQNLFKWMSFQKRDFFPKDFKAVTMRQWDNFFWWAELDNLPERSVVAPLEWPRVGAREAVTEGKIGGSNTIVLKTAAGSATVWLSPEMVNFDERVTIAAERKRIIRQISPSAEVLLEDVRTRGDRQHPFWAKVEVK